MFAQLNVIKNNSCASLVPYQSPQDESLFSLLSDEIKIIIFQKLGLSDLAHAALTCKQWKDLTQDPAIWQNLANQIGLNLIGINPKNEFRFFLQLKQQHLGEEVFNKLVQLPDWEEEIDFKCQQLFNEHGVYQVSDITKIQHVADGQDHFGKKIIGNELVFIFVTANRGHSKVFRFNLAFNPQSFTDDEYLLWTYDLDSCTGFFLSKKDSVQKRGFELSHKWIRLKQAFSKILKIHPPQLKTPESLIDNALMFNFLRDFYMRNSYLPDSSNE